MFKLLEPMPSPNNTNFERLFVPARREVQLAFDGRSALQPGTALHAPFPTFPSTGIGYQRLHSRG